MLVGYSGSKNGPYMTAGGMASKRGDKVKVGQTSPSPSSSSSSSKPPRLLDSSPSKMDASLKGPEEEKEEEEIKCRH